MKIQKLMKINAFVLSLVFVSNGVFGGAMTVGPEKAIDFGAIDKPLNGLIGQKEAITADLYPEVGINGCFSGLAELEKKLTRDFYARRIVSAAA